MAKFYGNVAQGYVSSQVASYHVTQKMVFTPDSGNHMLFFKEAVGAESVSDKPANDWRYDQGTPTVINDFSTDLGQAQDAGHFVGAVKRINFSNTATTMDGRFHSNDTSSGCNMEYGKMWAWDASHEYQESEGLSTTTSTSRQDKTTLTFTPGSTQDYLIIWSAQIGNSGTSYDCEVALDIDGTEYNVGNVEPDGTNEMYAAGGIHLINLDNTSHTIKIRYNSENTFGTARIQEARIIAIPLSSYTVNYDQETGTETSGSGTYADTAGSLTFTPGSEAWHLILGYCEVGEGGGVQLVHGSTVLDRINYMDGNDTSSFWPVFMSGIVKLPASSQTLKIQKRSSGGTITFRKPRVYAIDIGSDIQQYTHNYRQRIEADTDDALHNETDATFNTSNADVEAGIGGAGFGDVSNIGLRFLNADIEQAATIDEAYIYCHIDGFSGTPALTVLGIDEDNTATYSTLSNYTGRARTTASVSWNPSGFSASTVEETPDIKTIIQEIVDRASFASGNAIGLVIDDNGSSGTEYVRLEDYSSDPNEMSYIFARWNEEVSTGTAYTKDLAETVTMVDTKSFDTSKALSDAVALSDLRAMAITKGAFTEAIVLTDTIAMQFNLALLEALALVDTIVRAPGKALNEVITLVDSFDAVGTFYKALSEVVTLTDTLAKQGQKMLTEVITLTDTLATLFGKVLTETVTLTDTIARTMTRALTETITLADNLATQAQKTFTEVITLVDTLTTARTYVRAYTEAITLVDTIAKQTQRSFTEVITLVDSIVTAGTFFRALTETVTLVDTIAKQTQKSFAEVVTLADTLGTLIGKGLSEKITLADTFVKQTQRAFTETITLTDTIAHAISRAFTETITLADNVATVFAKNFSEAITLVDTLVTQGTFFKVLTEAVTLVDTLDKSIVKVFTETIALADTLGDFVIGKVFNEVVSLADTLTKQTQLAFTEVIALTDTLTRAIGRAFAEAITLTDTLDKLIGKALSEAVALVDSFDIVGTFYKALTETVTLADNFAHSLSRAFTEVITITDRLAKQAQKSFTEAITLVDDVIADTDLYIVANEILTVTDTLTKGLNKTLALSEVVTLVDTISNVFKGVIKKGRSILLTVADKAVTVLKSHTTILRTVKKDANVLKSKQENTHKLGTQNKDKNIL